MKLKLISVVTDNGLAGGFNTVVSIPDRN